MKKAEITKPNELVVVTGNEIPSAPSNGLVVQVILMLVHFFDLKSALLRFCSLTLFYK